MPFAHLEPVPVGLIVGTVFFLVVVWFLLDRRPRDPAPAGVPFGAGIDGPPVEPVDDPFDVMAAFELDRMADDGGRVLDDGDYPDW